MIEQSVAEPGSAVAVEVDSFPGLAVDAAATLGADFIVKGLRTAGDFEVEQQMAHTNYVGDRRPHGVPAVQRRLGVHQQPLHPGDRAVRWRRRPPWCRHRWPTRSPALLQPTSLTASTMTYDDDDDDDDDDDELRRRLDDDVPASHATATSATPRRCCAARSTSSPPRRRCRCRRRRGSTATRSSSCSRRRSHRLPDELRQARWMIKERQEFVAKTRREADELLEAARVQAERMVQRTEVVRAAEQRARQMIEAAEADARRLRHETEDFLDQRLGSFEILLDKLQKTVDAGRAAAVDRRRADGRASTSDDDDPTKGFFDQDRLTAATAVGPSAASSTPPSCCAGRAASSDVDGRRRRSPSSASTTPRLAPATSRRRRLHLESLDRRHRRHRHGQRAVARHLPALPAPARRARCDRRRRSHELLPARAVTDPDAFPIDRRPARPRADGARGGAARRCPTRRCAAPTAPGCARPAASTATSSTCDCDGRRADERWAALDELARSTTDARLDAVAGASRRRSPLTCRQPDSSERRPRWLFPRRRSRSRRRAAAAPAPGSSAPRRAACARGAAAPSCRTRCARPAAGTRTASPSTSADRRPDRDSMLPIAVDAMGGDRPRRDPRRRAPRRRRPASRSCSSARPASTARGDLPLIEATEVIAMDDDAGPGRPPQEGLDARARRRGGPRRQGQSAMISAGNTGATMAVGAAAHGPDQGRQPPGDRHADPGARARRRPSCSTPAPTPRCSPSGWCSSPRWARCTPATASASTDPKVGLLSIGEEPGKGDTLRKEAYELLARGAGHRLHRQRRGPRHDDRRRRRRRHRRLHRQRRAEDARGRHARRDRRRCSRRSPPTRSTRRTPTRCCRRCCRCTTRSTPTPTAARCCSASTASASSATARRAPRRCSTPSSVADEMVERGIVDEIRAAVAR